MVGSLCARLTALQYHWLQKVMLALFCNWLVKAWQLLSLSLHVRVLGVVLLHQNTDCLQQNTDIWGILQDSITLVCRSSSHAKLKYIQHSAPSDAPKL